METIAIVPKYMKVAERICRMVRDKQLMPGELLPTERHLAKALGVGYLTVRRANEELVKAGLIRREQGRGTILNAPASSRKACTIGFLSIGDELAGFLLQHYKMVNRKISELGHKLLFDMITPVNGHISLPDSFANEHLDVIVACGHLTESILAQLAELSVPVIVTGNAPSMPQVGMVDVDYEKLTCDITKTLCRELGYDYVWLVAEPLRLHYTRQMVEGYRQAINECNIPTELLSLCDSGDNSPFIRKFSHFYQAIGGSHAVIWCSGLPFVRLNELNGNEKFPENRLGVISYGPRTQGWTLPDINDVGDVCDNHQLLADATVSAIQQYLSGGGPLPHIRLEPVVMLDNTSGPNRRVKTAWKL